MSSHTHLCAFSNGFTEIPVFSSHLAQQDIHSVYPGAHIETRATLPEIHTDILGIREEKSQFSPLGFTKKSLGSNRNSSSSPLDISETTGKTNPSSPPWDSQRNAWTHIETRAPLLLISLRQQEKNPSSVQWDYTDIPGLTHETPNSSSKDSHRYPWIHKETQLLLLGPTQIYPPAIKILRSFSRDSQRFSWADRAQTEPEHPFIK